MNKKEWATLGILSAICVAAHWSLLPIALYLHNADFAVFSLFAEGIGVSGIWSPFYYQQPWGGTIYTLPRAIWNAGFEAIASGEWKHLWAHFSFLYLITPVLMTVATYLLVRAYASRAAAIAVGFAAAIGFQFWVHIYGNDFYFAYYFPGLALLIWRAQLSNPLLQLKPKQLFLAGALAGFTLYAYRAGVVYVAAFFFPVEWIWAQFKRVLKPQDRIEQVLLVGVSLFFGLYAYLRLLGETIGKVGGKDVRLHALSNLKFLIPLLLALWLKTLDWKRLPWRRLGLALGGAAVGFLPEIGYRIVHGFPRGAGFHIAWFRQAFDVFQTRLSHAFIELLSGYPHLNHYFGVERNAAIIMALFGTIFLLQKAWREARYRPIVFSGVLSLVLYLVVMTYDHGPTRYLFPLTPFLLVAIGQFWDRCAKTKLGLALAVVLLATHATYQLKERHVSNQAYQDSGRLHQITQSVRTFQKQNVRVVITDDFWQAANYSFVALAKPHFVSTGRKLGPEEGFELAQSEKRVGVLLTTTKPENGRVEMLGRTLKLEKIRDLPSRELPHTLWIGTVE